MSFPKFGIRRVAWVFCIGISILAFAGQPTTFKVNVNTVNMLATVHTRGGNIVSDLSQDDFILEEDGKPQEIRYFSRQADIPLTLGLLVDMSGSQMRLIADEQIASYQFFSQVLRLNKDRAFLMKFDSQISLLQDTTYSPALLENALNMLSSPMGQMGMGMGMGGRPGMMGGGGAGTLLLDAVYLACNNIMQNLEGRKAIIIISDGVDMGSRTGDASIMAANLAETIIYSICYADPSAYGGGNRRGGLLSSVLGNDESSRGRNTLQTLSVATGGRMFEAGIGMSLADVYYLIQEELRNQYNIGYQPIKQPNGEYRGLRLRTKDSNLDVMSRTGYYAR
jgi:VWFA-related protein